MWRRKSDESLLQEQIDKIFCWFCIQQKPYQYKNIFKKHFPILLVEPLMTSEVFVKMKIWRIKLSLYNFENDAVYLYNGILIENWMFFSSF